jgi:lysyl-tRNA synthetase class II
VRSKLLQGDYNGLNLLLFVALYVVAVKKINAFSQRKSLDDCLSLSSGWVAGCDVGVIKSNLVRQKKEVKMKRTGYAGAVRSEHIGQTITLKGWVARRRDLGGLIFIDLRDREGIMQLVVNPELASKEVLATAESLRSEFVIEVTGTVLARAQANDKLATGQVELEVTDLTVFKCCEDNTVLK